MLHKDTYDSVLFNLIVRVSKAYSSSMTNVTYLTFELEFDSLDTPHMQYPIPHLRVTYPSFEGYLPLVWGLLTPHLRVPYPSFKGYLPLIWLTWFRLFLRLPQALSGSIWPHPPIPLKVSEWSPPQSTIENPHVPLKLGVCTPHIRVRFLIRGWGVLIWGVPDPHMRDTWPSYEGYLTLIWGTPFVPKTSFVQFDRVLGVSEEKFLHIKTPIMMLDFWELRKGPKLNFCEKGDPHMRGNCPSYEGQVPHMRGWYLIWGWPNG